ncbi:hypothetical protein SteCoe_22267 [Stentor coeruleus]|uniref:Neuroguidin n=1 Tax=Stentor coeruleus TaxID=5963 RepID=A0A1R2BN78_9CILI|nr:hypothetical protein SteCoe_22267 [Stentor coeruleus]
MEEGSGKSQDFVVLIKDIFSRISSLSQHAQELNSDKNSYMDLKLNLLLDYFVLFTNKLTKDASGDNRDELTKSLIKHKCFIERLKPLDHKLQYQLDKIAQGNVDEDFKLKPNPNSMDTQLTVNEKPGIYKAPKLQAAIFTDKTKKSERDEERLKKKLARSSLVKSLKDELDDNPMEIKSGRNKRLKEIEDMQKRFEEENFVRVQLSKKDKKIRRKLERQDDNEDEMEDVGALMKLMKSDKKKLDQSLNYKRKKMKFREEDE